MHEDNLIWIDLEMTGLSPEEDIIIEIATVVTDSQLNILAEGPVYAIHQPEERLMAMDGWNTKQHNESGLVERIRQSKVTMAMAEAETLAFVSKHVPAGKSPMCGNSICQDRRFLYHQMPMLQKYFHYRNLDVSTIKELARRWYNDEVKFVKPSTHLALADVYDSISELKFYREKIFTSGLTLNEHSVRHRDAQ